VLGAYYPYFITPTITKSILLFDQKKIHLSGSWGIHFLLSVGGIQIEQD